MLEAGMPGGRRRRSRIEASGTPDRTRVRLSECDAAGGSDPERPAADVHDDGMAAQREGHHQRNVERVGDCMH